MANGLQIPGGRMRETTRAAAAYALYAAMGPTRTLIKLQKEIANLPEWQGRVPQIRRIEEWSAKLNWQQRVKVYDTERAEERRVQREEQIDKMNQEHFEIGRSTLQKALNQIEYLIEADKMGSQASVQLVKISADLQRLALGADKPAEQQPNVAPGIQIIIETDSRPALVPLPAATTVVEAEVVDVSAHVVEDEE